MEIHNELENEYLEISKKIKNIISEYENIDSIIDMASPNSYKCKKKYNFPKEFLNPINYFVHRLLKLIICLDNILIKCKYNRNKNLSFIKDIVLESYKKKRRLLYIIRNIFTILKLVPNFGNVRNPLEITFSPVNCQLYECKKSITYCHPCFRKNLSRTKNLSVYQRIIQSYLHINSHLADNIEHVLLKNMGMMELKKKYDLKKYQITLMKSKLDQLKEKYKQLCDNYQNIKQQIDNIPKAETLKTEFVCLKRSATTKIVSRKLIKNVLRTHLINIFKVYKLCIVSDRRKVSKIELKMLVISIYLPENIFKYSHLSTQRNHDASANSGKKVELIATVLGYVVKLLLILSIILNIPIPQKLEYFSNQSKISNYILHPLDSNFNMAVDCLLWTIINFNYSIFGHYIKFLNKEKQKQFEKYRLKLKDFETNLKIVHVLQFLKQTLLILI